MRIGPADARRFYINSGVPSWTHKISTFDPCCPPFYRGQNVPNFGPNFDLSRFQTAVFFNWGGGFIGKQKQTCQGLMIGLPPHQTWCGWAPLTPRTVGAMGTPKGYKWKIFYISSIPAAHAEYSATTVIPTDGAVADVKRLPCRISQFAPTVHRGLPKRVKVENFLYIQRSSGTRQVHRHQCYTTYWGRSWCKVYRAISPNSPPTFHRGAKISSPH